MCILQISEQVDDVCVTHDKDLCLDCLQEDSDIRWKFTITTEVRKNPVSSYIQLLALLHTKITFFVLCVCMCVCVEVLGSCGSTESGKWCCFLVE